MEKVKLDPRFNKDNSQLNFILRWLYALWLADKFWSANKYVLKRVQCYGPGFNFLSTYWLNKSYLGWFHLTIKWNFNSQLTNYSYLEPTWQRHSPHNLEVKLGSSSFRYVKWHFVYWHYVGGTFSFEDIVNERMFLWLITLL